MIGLASNFHTPIRNFSGSILVTDDYEADTSSIPGTDHSDVCRISHHFCGSQSGPLNSGKLPFEFPKRHTFSAPCDAFHDSIHLLFINL